LWCSRGVDDVDGAIGVSGVVGVRGVGDVSGDIDTVTGLRGGTMRGRFGKLYIAKWKDKNLNTVSRFVPRPQANRPYVILSGACFDGLVVFGQAASSDALAKNLEERYFVLDGRAKGIQGQFRRELGPLGPMSVGGGGSTRRDSGLHGFLRKAEITAEVMCCDGVQSL